MAKNRQALELAVDDEMGRAIADLQEEIMDTGDMLADDQLKLALLEDNNKPEYQDLRVFYIRRLVRNRRKLDDLRSTLEKKQEQLANMKEELRIAPAEGLVAQ